MIYEYKAADASGKVVSGFIESPDSTSAATSLRAKALVPVAINQKKDRSFSLPFFHSHSRSSLIIFTRQLSSMLASGLTLMQALLILKDQVNDQSLRVVIEGLVEDVQEGKKFSEGLKKYPAVFDKLYVSLIKAGESSGFLDKILLRLADNLEKDQALKGKLKSALVYPVIVVVLMIVVVVIMMIVVIPQLSSLYTSLNVSLPLPTQIVIAVSNFFVNFWWLMVIVGGGFGYMFNKWRVTEHGKLALDVIVLKIPIVGTLIQKSLLVEFARTLSMLIGAGALVVDSLNQAAEVADNTIYRSAILDVSKRVEKGISVGDAMNVYTLFPPILVQMVKVGEQTGKLDEALIKASEYFEREVNGLVSTLTAAMEPFIMVVLGIGVAFLVISVITPIYNLTSAIK